MKRLSQSCVQVVLILTLFKLCEIEVNLMNSVIKSLGMINSYKFNCAREE